MSVGWKVSAWCSAGVEQPYEYASDNPVSLTDPTGQRDITWCDKTLWWDQTRNCYVYMTESTVLRVMHDMQRSAAASTRAQRRFTHGS
jgi:hypothetical protein